ncbi:MAG TPA: RDD family protein [Acidimicrobiia bacterium]|nr:RDD family protein [Acidimicrobiia bacterium]
MTKRTEHILNGRTAGFVTRLFAFVADAAVVAGIIAIGGWIAVLIDNVIAQVGLDLRISLGAIYVFLIPLIIGLYFVMFWSLTGRTIGKWLLGLRVIGHDGHPPTIGRSILRVGGYGLSAIVFWIGYVWVLFDDDRQAWHDHIARTWVIYDYSRQPAIEFVEEV